jgi:hypothetical protein
MPETNNIMAGNPQSFEIEKTVQLNAADQRQEGIV